MMNNDLMEMHAGMLQKDFRRQALWYWLDKSLVSGRVLDAGGGSGYMSVKMLEKGYYVALAEPDRQLIEFAQQRIQEKDLTERFVAYQSELEALEVGTVGTFQNIVCLDVLEHIYDDGKALSHLSNLLEPGGQILISVPAMPLLYGKRDVAYGHYRRYTKQTLIDLIYNCNLKYSRLAYWNLLGIAPYFFFEKILHKPINDSLRKSGESSVVQSLRYALVKWLTIELSLPLKAGLSLLAFVHRAD